MKLHIKETIDTKSIVNNINEINNSDISNSDKVSRISRILNGIEIGCYISLSKGVDYGAENFEHCDWNKWCESGYTYNTYDIADEIVNGRLRMVTDIWKPKNSKSSDIPNSHVSFLRRSGWNI